MKLSKKFLLPAVVLGATVGTSLGISRTALADVTVVRNSTARAAIFAPPAVMAPDKGGTINSISAEQQAEFYRRRLRESVNDLSMDLSRISGAKVEVVTGARPAGDKRVPILIGDLAVQAFGAPKTKSPYKQGFRMVVSSKGIGLMGESDEATSYAIYEMLDRLGCRWYLPGEMGEVIPQSKTITLRNLDFSDVPDTYYRSITYADEPFRRRTRQGGLHINAAHALEFFITKEQREQHPEWRAIIGGKPHDVRLKWSHPGVQQAVADAIIAQLDKQYIHTISLSPEDGNDFDESDDRAWDAGDLDTSMGVISLTDRFVKFANIVATKVTKKYPDVMFGFLAYVQYTRPPVREKLHPNLVPQIAPITYCRAHAMTDTHICPSRPQIRPILEGWAKASPHVSYYNYMFHLAEVTVPYPMIHQMTQELPIIYANNVKFWQPETMSNYEHVLPGMVLTNRKSWDNKANSKAVLDEFFTRFYGAAEKPMRSYWLRFDEAWIKNTEHSGMQLSYPVRFTPQMLQAARADMNAALAACRTDMERQRVQLQNAALEQFELYMKMRRDLMEGRLATLSADADRWMARQLALGEQYQANHAFAKVGWTPLTIGGHYFKSFNGATYQDASRVARDFNIIAPPLREWRYVVDKENKGEELGFEKVEFNDAGWKTTDLGVDTWSSLGIDAYMGAMWYRQTLRTGDLPAGKKTYLWVSASDGNVKVFVNGRHIPYVNAKGETVPEYSGYSEPASFDITSALIPNAVNQITIRGTRNFLNELGSGGLLSPVYVYQEK